MPTTYRDVTVEVDIDLDDFDDEDLIEELEARGYQVSREPEVISAEHYWNQGNHKEALIMLERQFPEMIGLSKLIE